MLVAVPPSNLTQSMASSPLMPHAHHTHATKTMEPSRSICSIWNPYPTPISMLMDMFLRVPTLLSSNVVMSMWKPAAKMDKQEEKKVSEHCREEGCIGKYIPRGPRDFPDQGFCTPRLERLPEGRGMQNFALRGRSPCPREISKCEGVYFPIHPDSRQCSAILSALAGKY